MSLATEKDERAIRQVITDWLVASKAGDSATVLSLMTDDVVFMIPGQAPFGKAAFEARAKSMQPQQFEATHQVLELQVVGDWAWLRSHLDIKMSSADGSQIHKSGHILTILRKGADSRWRLSRDANLLA